MFVRTIVTAAVVVAVAVGSSAQGKVANCARTYTIVAGDTCDSISAKENVSTFQLASVNNATINASCTNLSPGKKLCLGIFGQDCQVTHLVTASDTCSSIVAAAGTTLDILLKNNPNINSSCNIFPGEVLCTADDVIVPQNSTVAAA